MPFQVVNAIVEVFDKFMVVLSDKNAKAATSPLSPEIKAQAVASIGQLSRVCTTAEYMVCFRFQLDPNAVTAQILQYYSTGTSDRLFRVDNLDIFQL